MAIDRIYLGTWLPRTSVHLREIYDFLKNCSGVDLDQNKLKKFHQQLNVSKIIYKNNFDFDSMEFVSEKINVIITEDGIIQIMINGIDNINASLKQLESFYINKLGPALAYLFSRGAPIPQTLTNITELYPKILVGHDISREEVEKIIKDQDSALLAINSTEDLEISYGQDIEVFNVLKKDSAFDALILNAIFVDSFSDLLKRYLIAHRNTWSDIDSIRKESNILYRDFPSIRNKILESLKNISFIKTRLKQMSDILSARNIVTNETLKQKITKCGFENFKVLESSNNYFDNLYQMTADYAESTLRLFETLVHENTQREVRILQQVTIAGAIVGFFGMNIVFPWEERWPNMFFGSLIVIGIIILVMTFFYFMIKKLILNRKFNITEKIEKK